LIGSGDGVARGRLNGSLRWSMFAGDCPLLPGRGRPIADGDHVCTTNPAFLLETEDGATIWFDARGFGIRRQNVEPRWVLTASLRFQTDDERYAWLNRAAAVWEGVFDEDAGRARYRARLMAATSGPLQGAEAALAAAAIPPSRRGRERTCRLSGGERALYEWILRSFATGAPPAADAVALAAGGFEIDVEEAFARFAAEDLVHRDQASGAIAVAYPFAGRARGHRVLIDGRIWVEAMCAIDALGIAALLDASIEVDSRDPSSGAEVWVRVDPGDGAWWEPQSAVMLAGTNCGEGPSFGGCCDVLNFFETRATAERYLREHPIVSATTVSISDAIEAGRIVFGGVFEER
jgi:hypothetical protein